VPIPAELQSPEPDSEPTEDRLKSALREASLELEATKAQLLTCQQDLERTRRQLADLEELIRDLPQIFERKFHQRLQPLLDQQQLLAQDNYALREQARRLLPPAPPPPPPAPEHELRSARGSSQQDAFEPLRALRQRWLRRGQPPA
jgi:chromosome segregation ATPase